MRANNFLFQAFMAIVISTAAAMPLLHVDSESVSDKRQLSVPDLTSVTTSVSGALTDGTSLLSDGLTAVTGLTSLTGAATTSG